MSRLILLLPMALMLLASSVAHGAGLVPGHYRFVVPLGAAALWGAFPLEIDGVPGAVLHLNTSPTGKVTGELEFGGEKTPVTGTVKTRAGYLRLTVAGRPKFGRFSVVAKLKGGEFVGTAVTSKGRVPCTLDVTGTLPLEAAMDFDIVPDARGRLRGTGSMTACGQSVPVKVIASNSAKQVSTLALNAGAQYWRGTGPSKDGGFVAKWVAQGFGALAKGNGLQVIADP